MPSRKGFALVTSLILLAVLMALLTAYFTLSQIESSTTRSTANQTAGFYAAEAGLNLRAEELRTRFLGYNRPSGTSPSATNPCTGSNQGSGDFACKTYTVGGRQVLTYVVEQAGNPQTIRIPPGETYQNLNAQEYRYSVLSRAIGPQNRPEAILEMVFKSRLVPLFQFAAFYNKDLEILPGPSMTLSGPVHSNGDLYLDAGTSLDIMGQVTTAGDLYRGRKNDSSCSGRPVRVADPSTQRELPACSGRTRISQSQLGPWNGMVLTHVDPVVVPPPEALDPPRGGAPGGQYWNLADLRVVLNLNTSPAALEVRRPDGALDFATTTTLRSCPGVIGGRAVGQSSSFYNNREKKTITMLEVDMQGLLSCINANPSTFGFALDNTTEGGLVFHFTVEGSQSTNINAYGVRVRNGAELGVSGAPQVRGITVVTDQAIYVQGDYNRTNWRPAAFLADSLNILSNNWSDANSTRSLSNRVASETTVNAAFLSGTDTTGGAEGTAGQGGAYNGGLENYPRFHERWTGQRLNYRGSLVSLGRPRYVNGSWCGTGSGCNIYDPPGRNWAYEDQFNDAANLPPLSPRFVYLRQERFIRQFEQ
jgi:hypothetical protein